MPTVPGERHGADRQRTGPKGERHTLHDNKVDHTPAFVKEDEAERLADVMFNAGSDYLIAKTNSKFSPEDIPQGDAGITAGVDPIVAADKIIKMAVSRLQQDGHPLASKAQKVLAHKDDASAPEHVVAQKIRNRLTMTEQLAEHGGHMFQGVNPDAGSESGQAKLRHHRGTGAHITAGTRHDKNPDVTEA